MTTSFRVDEDFVMNDEVTKLNDAGGYYKWNFLNVENKQNFDLRFIKQFDEVTKLNHV